MLSLDVDIRECNDWLTELPETQIPFAASKMLNALALDVQQATRARMHDIFHVRRDQWVDRSDKITHFATKTELYAEVSIQPPGGDGAAKADILGKFEDQTEKTPTNGGKSIVVPIQVKRTGAGVISNTQRPKAFDFIPIRTTGSGTVFVGDRNTLMIQRPDGSGVILVKNVHHHVPGAADGFVLYILKPSVRITPDLHFEAIAERTVITKTNDRWDEAATLALRTAR